MNAFWDVVRAIGFPAESLLTGATYVAFIFGKRVHARMFLLAAAGVSTILFLRVVALEHQPWQIALKATWTAGLFYAWWRLGGSDDFRRGRRKLAQKARELGGRLVAVPATAGAR